MVKFLQINLNHCEVAQELLPQLIQEEKDGIVLVSGYYRDLSDSNWVGNITSKATWKHSYNRSIEKSPA